MSEFNWSALKKTADDAIKPLEDGTYTFLCTKAEYRKAQTGSPMVVATLAVQGGPKHGKTLQHNFVLTIDNSFALAMWFRNFAAFGIGDETFAMLSGQVENDLSFLASTLVGRSAQAEVGQRMYMNQMRNEFKSFSPVVGGAVAAPGPMVPSGVSTSPTVAPGVPSVPTTPSVPSAPSPAPATGPSVPSVPQPASTGPSAPPQLPF